DKALQLLGEYLTSMMDGADDTLFDLAEAAHSNEQDRYFAAMRELRVKRSGVESSFQQAMQNAFLALAYNQAESSQKAVDFESLALVNDEDVETDVAISNMARRVRHSCEEQLRIFNHRLEYLFEGRKELGEERNPLEPQVIAACFEESLQRLELDIGTKLIVLKLFERLVLTELGYIVTEANQELIDAGTLPDLTAVPIAAVRKPHETYRPSTGPESAAAFHVVSTAQMFNMLQDLLSALHSVANTQQGGLATNDGVAVMQGNTPMLHGAPIAPDTPIKTISSDELVQVLGRLQQVENTLEAEGHSVRSELATLLKEE